MIRFPRSILRAPFAAALVLAAVAPGCAEARHSSTTRTVAATVPLVVATKRGPITYRVEVARTPAEQEKGLMFRTALPKRGGMIFPMNPPREATFWMKNTVIPLDMVFIRTDGTIARILAMRAPYSLDIDDAGEVVGYVLELAGGEAARAGLRPGDRVRGLAATH